MKLTTILAHIRNMKDRDGLRDIMNIADARASKLSDIDGDRERKRLWEKVEKLGLQPGDMVFIHAEPRQTTKKVRERYTKPNGQKGWREEKQVIMPSGQHSKLWGHALTVKEVKVRSKEIVVRLPGSTVDHRLSPYTCEKLKLSKEPTAAALANGLMTRTVKSPAFTLPVTALTKKKKMPVSSGKTITIRRPPTYRGRT